MKINLFLLEVQILQKNQLKNWQGIQTKMTIQKFLKIKVIKIKIKKKKDQKNYPKNSPLIKLIVNNNYNNNNLINNLMKLIKKKRKNKEQKEINN